MLSTCFCSNRRVFKGWFLKLNKDPVLAMTIYVICPNART